MSLHTRGNALLQATNEQSKAVPALRHMVLLFYHLSRLTGWGCAGWWVFSRKENRTKKKADRSTRKKNRLAADESDAEHRYQTQHLRLSSSVSTSSVSWSSSSVSFSSATWSSSMRQGAAPDSLHRMPDISMGSTQQFSPPASWAEQSLPPHLSHSGAQQIPPPADGTPGRPFLQVDTLGSSACGRRRERARERVGGFGRRAACQGQRC